MFEAEAISDLDCPPTGEAGFVVPPLAGLPAMTLCMTREKDRLRNKFQ